jgi:hypothetical protein
MKKGGMKLYMAINKSLPCKCAGIWKQNITHVTGIYFLDFIHRPLVDKVQEIDTSNSAASSKTFRDELHMFNKTIDDEPVCVCVCVRNSSYERYWHFLSMKCEYTISYKNSWHTWNLVVRWIRDVITTINRGMLACTWKELEFWPDFLHVTQAAHIEVRWVYEKKTLCMYP